MHKINGYAQAFEEMGIQPSTRKFETAEDFARGFERCSILKEQRISYSSSLTRIVPNSDSLSSSYDWYTRG